MLHDAVLYDKLENDLVQCNLCAHRCRIRDGKEGICKVRVNQGGQLYTRVYGNLISENVDPIEKKPLYHFLPGSHAYSIATPGCNFHCEWCQNWQISQMPRIMQMHEVERITPDAVVERALQLGCQSIAYTYTEPTIFFEYSNDVSRKAKTQGLKNIFVTNGFMTSEMLEMYEPCLDAANVDIKAFNDETYRKLMGGRLAPVLESCRKMKSLGVWLEITTLIVPGVNDNPEELEGLARFILDELGPATPWHLSRFFPHYQMRDRNPTDEAVLFETKAMGESLGLNYIYLGNVFGPSTTKCKECGHELISRHGYHTRLIGLDDAGRCENCGAVIDGVGLEKIQA